MSFSRNILAEFGCFNIFEIYLLSGPSFVDIEHRLAQSILKFLWGNQFGRNDRVSVFIQMIDVFNESESFDLFVNLPVMS